MATISPEFDPELLGVLDNPWELIRYLKNATREVRDAQIALLGDLAAAENRVRTDYSGRYPVELIQNAHDACAEADVRGRVWFHITNSALLVANEGHPFNRARLESIIRLGASNKHLYDGQQTIGYKGIGFTAPFPPAVDTV